MANPISFIKKLKKLEKENCLLEVCCGEDAFSALDLVEVDVAIFTEGTYPYLKGGVSSVIHQVIEEHPNLSFGVVHIAWDRNSKREYLFPHLPQIKWVYTIFLSDNEKSQENKSSILKKNIFKTSGYYKDLVDRLLIEIEEIIKGNKHCFQVLYQDYFNPLTRRINIQELLGSSQFINLLIEKFKTMNIPLVDLYWLQRELNTLSLSVLDQAYPLAKVYHSHTSGYAGFAASLASLQHSRRFVLTEHSLYIRDVLQQLESIYNPKNNKDQITYLRSETNKIKRHIWEQWFKSIGEITYHQTSAVSYLYDEIATDAISYGSISSKHQIIPNGIKFQRFENARLQQEKRDESRFIDANHVWKIGFIGRIVPVKGVLDLIDCIYLFKKMFSQKFSIELIGPTDEDQKYFEECLLKVKKLGLESEMHFLGPQNVSEFLEEIDLCVLSSHSEALPVVILESMAAGVPVVSTDVGSVRQIMIGAIKEEEKIVAKAAGAVSSAKNPAQLAQLIKNVLENKELYLSYREEGPKRVLKKFQLNDVMKQYGDLYRI